MNEASGIPRPVAATVRNLTRALEQILGSSLVGVYLYGSLTQRSFDPARSDIDCLVVVRRDLSDAQFRRLRTRLAHEGRADPWMRRVQMQVLLRRRLLRHDTRGALYQFGKLRRSGSDANPIVWMNVLATGITLAGPNPRSFLPPITEDMISAALERETGYLRAEMSNPASAWRDQRFYREYAVLTLCRILYTHRKGRVTSKPVAARWALRTVPSRWHALIRAARSRRPGGLAALPIRRIARFIEHVRMELGRSVPPATAARAATRARRVWSGGGRGRPRPSRGRSGRPSRRC